MSNPQFTLSNLATWNFHIIYDSKVNKECILLYKENCDYFSIRVFILIKKYSCTFVCVFICDGTENYRTLRSKNLNKNRRRHGTKAPEIQIFHFLVISQDMY